jgi:hypothetical protein
MLLYGCWRVRAAFLLSLIQADCLLSKALDRSLDGAQMTRLQLQLAAGSAAVQDCSYAEGHVRGDGCSDFSLEH